MQDNEEIVKPMTLFSTVYDRFLDLVTEELYLYWTKEEILEDAKSYLMTAIFNFEYPKVNIRDFDKDYQDYENHTTGRFNVELGFDEIEMLANLMGIAWVERQLRDSSLTKMVYTGNDAKSAGVNNQVNALNKLLDILNAKMKVLKFNYGTRDFDKDGTPIPWKPSLSGKKTNRERRNGRLR